jgi:hypothetical protein
VHFHDIPDQGISQETWTFHTNKAGEACCPFHQMLLLEAADEQKKNVFIICGGKIDMVSETTCLLHNFVYQFI